MFPFDILQFLLGQVLLCYQVWEEWRISVNYTFRVGVGRA
jgi:hypothetical protein